MICTGFMCNLSEGREKSSLSVNILSMVHWKTDLATVIGKLSMILTVCALAFSFVCRILSCLMEHLYTEKMVEDCEHRLLELQYFISRDWK